MASRPVTRVISHHSVLGSLVLVGSTPTSSTVRRAVGSLSIDIGLFLLLLLSYHTPANT